MRIDHVFYGNVGGRYPTPEELDDAMRAARRLRAEAAHQLLRGALEWLRGALRRRPAAKLQTC
jgi:hypothetical protein